MSTYKPRYFKLSELYHSGTALAHGIMNLPPANCQRNLLALIQYVLDPLRQRYGRPIYVNSGYRTRELNALVSTAPNSMHLYGIAADIRTKANTREENAKLYSCAIWLMKRNRIPVRRLIDEYGYRWLHIEIDIIDFQNQTINPQPTMQIMHLGQPKPDTSLDEGDCFYPEEDRPISCESCRDYDQCHPTDPPNRT